MGQIKNGLNIDAIKFEKIIQTLVRCFRMCSGLIKPELQNVTDMTDISV